MVFSHWRWMCYILLCSFFHSLVLSRFFDWKLQYSSWKPHFSTLHQTKRKPTAGWRKKMGKNVRKKERDAAHTKLLYYTWIAILCSSHKVHGTEHTCQRQHTTENKTRTLRCDARLFCMLRLTFKQRTFIIYVIDKYSNIAHGHSLNMLQTPTTGANNITITCNSRSFFYSWNKEKKRKASNKKSPIIISFFSYIEILRTCELNECAALTFHRRCCFPRCSFSSITNSRFHCANGNYNAAK